MNLETESSSSTAKASLDPVDQIADLLVDEEEKDEEKEQDVERDEEEQEVKEEEEDGQSEEDGEGDGDVTWSGVLGVDESKLELGEDGTLKGVKVKVDGNESTVDLNTLIAGYQTAKSTTQKSQALAQEKRKFEAERQQVFEVFNNKLQEADAFMKLVHKKLMSDFENIDLRELRMTNPAEYAAVIADRQQREAEIRQMFGAIHANRNALMQAQQQQQEQQRSEFYQEQAARTLDMFPDWKDPEKAKSDFSRMKEFVTDFGFTDEEFNKIADPRVIAVLRTAVQAKEAKTATETKVVKAKANIRSSRRSRQTRPQSKLDRLVKRAKSAQGPNKRDAQTDAIAELLING